MSVISFPFMYVPDSTKGRPLFLGQVYVGKPDLDPQVEINQKQLNIIQEDGTVVEVDQPFILSAGGVPQYNGKSVRLDVDGNFSIKILDKNGGQQYYIDNVYEGEPVTVEALIEALSPYERPFDSTVELKLSTLSAGSTAKTYGYREKGGSGAGKYLVKTESEALADGDTLDGYGNLQIANGNWAILQTDSAFIDVLQYGAKGDGTTPDNDAVRAAVLTGRSIDFGEGYTYLLDDLVLDQSDVSYIGNSVLKLVEESSGDLIRMATNADNVTFDGLEFDGNGVNQVVGTEVNNAVKLSDYHKGLTFKNCYFHDFGQPTKQPSNPNVPANYNYSDGIVSNNSGAGAIDDTLIQSCKFENCYAAIAIRAAGDGLTIKDCEFKHCADNSIKTRVGMKNHVITGNRDEDTRGIECWGEFLRLTDNYSLNSHRHGVSGGVTKAYIAGNSFEHTTPNLGSLYAIEIGVSKECRVIGNRIEEWDGAAAIRMTDSEEGSQGTIIAHNQVLLGTFTDGAIGSSNSQSQCVYANNYIESVGGIALSPRGSDLIIQGNIVIDKRADLENALTTTCLSIPVGTRQTITGNTFRLAGKWLTGTYRNVISGNFDDSIITDNYFSGGRNTISGGLARALVTGNHFTDVDKVINSDSGSQDGVMTNNRFTNITTLLDSGDYAGFTIQYKKVTNAAAAPTTGDWVVGDRVEYTVPTAGGKMGAVCTTAGTPGVWKEWGAIDA